MARKRKSQPIIITPAHRARVVELKASGLAHKSIAAVVGLPLAVLEENFSAELEHAEALADAQLLRVRWEQARNGNQKALRAIEDRAARAERQAREAKAEHPGPDTRLKGRPGIDRPLSNREQNIFTGAIAAPLGRILLTILWATQSRLGWRNTGNGSGGLSLDA
jgi:hypothetical protein